VAAKFDLKVLQIDVETTYLNGKIDVEIFMETPELHEMLERMTTQEGDAKILSTSTHYVEEDAGIGCDMQAE